MVYPRVSLLLYSSPIPLTNTVKVLGLLFHNHHSWLPHIKVIKTKTHRVLNMPKYLSHLSCEYNRKVLLPLYNSLVHSILDGGSPICGLAPPSCFVLLDPMQNAAIRICTGACRTSSAVSLCVESRYSALYHRRLNPAASLLTSVQLPSIPVHDILFNSLCHRTPYRKSFTHMRYFLKHSLSRNFRFHCLPPIFPILTL